MREAARQASDERQRTPSAAAGRRCAHVTDAAATASVRLAELTTKQEHFQGPGIILIPGGVTADGRGGTRAPIEPLPALPSRQRAAPALNLTPTLPLSRLDAPNRRSDPSVPLAAAMGRTDASPAAAADVLAGGRDQQSITSPGTPSGKSLMRRNSWSFSSSLGDIQDDLIVLKNIWFSNLVPGRKSSASHAQRLESFYGPQAAACERAARAGAAADHARHPGRRGRRQARRRAGGGALGARPAWDGAGQLQGLPRRRRAAPGVARPLEAALARTSRRSAAGAGPLTTHDATAPSPLRRALQMTSSGPTSCGAAGPCWRRARRACAAARTSCGSTSAPAPG